MNQLSKFLSIVLSVFLVLASCKSEQDEIADQVDSNEIIIESTAYEFPALEFPECFYLDSLRIYDSITRASYTAYFVQCDFSRMDTFNAASLAFAKAQIEHEQQYVDPYMGNEAFTTNFSYLLRPVEMYTNFQIYSISNIIDTYTEGGNHHNYTRKTFNYNSYTNELINFDDLFELTSKEDSIAFIDFAEENSSGCDDWDWPFSHLDFAFAEKGLYIYPNASWACGETYAFLPVYGHSKFIRKEWL